MRDIKFRAWNPSMKRFSHFPAYVLTGDWKDKIGLFFESEDDVYLTAYTEPMQFTGLHDKNGKAIFEGDVVEWLVNGDVIRKGIVEFVDEYGGYDLKNFNDDFHVCNDWLRGEYTILGNIHENPELLTK